MNRKCNFHTHTAFCDGKDTPEELVAEAIKRGFTDLGFTGHSYNEPDKHFAMSPSETEQYRAEIRALEKKYGSKIRIFCGIEQDYFSKESTAGYDYVIGSVHYVMKDGRYISVDESPESFKNSVERFYSGDFDAICEDYYKLVSKVIDRTNADIIGHFDLISKFFEISDHKETPRYLAAAEQAAGALLPYGKPFEINTGAIARGYRTTPYPSFEILKMICEGGGDIMITSDCHDKNYLDCAFDEAAKLAYKAGFRRQAVITKEGIEYIPLNLR